MGDGKWFWLQWSEHMWISWPNKKALKFHTTNTVSEKDISVWQIFVVSIFAGWLTSWELCYVFWLLQWLFLMWIFRDHRFELSRPLKSMESLQFYPTFCCPTIFVGRFFSGRFHCKEWGGGNAGTSKFQDQARSKRSDSSQVVGSSCGENCCWCSFEGVLVFL